MCMRIRLPGTLYIHPQYARSLITKEIWNPCFVRGHRTWKKAVREYRVVCAPTNKYHVKNYRHLEQNCILPFFSLTIRSTLPPPYTASYGLKFYYSSLERPHSLYRLGLRGEWRLHCHCFVRLLDLFFSSSVLSLRKKYNTWPNESVMIFYFFFIVSNLTTYTAFVVLVCGIYVCLWQNIEFLSNVVS